MAYGLKRTRDGAGDSGLMSEAYFPDQLDEFGVMKKKNNAKPEIGASIRVGSPYSRTYQAFDYWTTTPVTEILEEWTEAREGGGAILYVRFKTTNSEYIWSCDR